MVRKMTFIFSILLFSSIVLAQETETGRTSAVDFAVIAASGSMMEIELGKLALEKGESERVKNLGQSMVRDHSKASDELKDIAQKNNIQLPDSMLCKHKEHFVELSKLSGTEFDKAYINLLLEDHEEDIKKFEEASEKYENEEVRNWARKNLSTLRQHEELIRSIKQSAE